MDKRGFTLIELLAVIVILAIIAVIAVPIVLNIIDETKESATLRSAEMYLNAVEMSVAQATLKNKNIESKTYNIMSDGNICLETLTAGKCIGTGNRENNEEDILKVEVNGEAPTSGKIAITNGNISSIELNYKDDKTIVKNSDGDLVYKEAPTLASCELKSGTEKAIGAKYECDFGDGARNFYILELGRNPVSNTTLESDEVALILEGNYDTTTQYWCDQSGANPSNNVCAADGLTAKLDEIATAWTELERDQIGLPSMEQIMVADGKSETAYTGHPSLSNAWLYNWDNSVWGDTVYGYWSSSPDVGDSLFAWYVDCLGNVNNFFVHIRDHRGVRPVITLKI